MEKFEFPFNNIVNGKPEQKDKIKESWQKEADDFEKEVKPRCAGLEQSTTKEEEQNIEQTSRQINEIVQCYGAPEKPSPKVIMLQSGGVFEVTNGKFRDGVCYHYRRRILIDSCDSKINFATCLAHEMFHLAGYTSLRFSQETQDDELHRVGISIFGKDGEIVYFAEIEEAIIAEAVQIYFDQYLRKDSRFADEIKKTDFVKGWLKKYYNWAKMPLEKQNEILDNIYSFPDVNDLIEKLNGSNNEEYKFGFLYGYIEGMFEDGVVAIRERIEERKKLDLIVGAILKHANGKYKDRQEIINIFMQANFSGKLLPLARMIENTFGKGAFRSLGKDSAEAR
jgi:hypothetical protein